MKNINKTKFIIISIVFFAMCLFGINVSDAASTSYDINGMNASKYPGYKELLQDIQKQYPNWKIKLLYTGLDWNYVIENECTGHGGIPKSLIYDTYDQSWRCQESTCKNVKYDVSKRWYCASQHAVEYMMDPRNSLNAAYIFQFQDLSSSVGDKDAVKKMTENTFLYNDSYIDAIIEAAKTSNISPFHIVARIKLEQGTSGIGSMNGYLYKTEEGKYVKVYNLFNINVSGNDTEEGLLAGAKYAYEQGWFSVEECIKGGAEFLKTQYINRGQTTLYFQKYNVVESNNLFEHQYMQNIRAANDEGNSMYQAYVKNGILNSTFEFTIPVYENMPKLAVSRPQYIPVEKITPEQETYTIGVNEVINIGYSYSPSNASNIDFTWTASDSKILSVYWNKVRGLKAGTAYVIVKTGDGTVEKRIKIVVKEKTGLTPEKTTYTIEENDVINIKCTYSPSNLTAEDFTWTASNSKILSVYWNKVRGLKAGTAYVIVKSKDGTFETKIKVVVEDSGKVEMTPEKTTYTIDKNEVINIKATYSSSKVTAEDFTWTASNSKILSVYWNKVRGLKAGTAYVIVKSLDGTFETKIKVVVEDSGKVEMTPEKTTYTIDKNEVINIKATYSSSKVTAEDFTWTASNSKILSVYWNKVRGLKAGTAYVIVKSLEGTFETKIKVVVKDSGEVKITPKQETYTIKKNQVINIDCTYSPSKLTAEDFTWTASDSKILSVYWDKVRGLKTGTAYVIVKSLDGTYEKKIKIVVTE